MSVIDLKTKKPVRGDTGQPRKFSDDAQCLIENGEGMWFLCPRNRRDEANHYFEWTYEQLEENEKFMPEPLPDYLTPINSPHHFHFYRPVIE